MLLFRTSLIALLALVTLPLTAQRTTAPRSGRPRIQKNDKPPVDPATAELKRRYDALQAATASGDPAAVTEAGKRVAALALGQMANLRMLVGTFAQAMELYRKSLEIENTAEAHLSLAVAALRAGRIDETLTQTAGVLEKDPANARAWFVQGKAQMAKEDYHSAEDSLSHSLELASDVNAAYALGVTLLNLGEKKKADEVFAQMLEAYGDKAIWHVVFAGAYRETKFTDDAIREFHRALAMDPNVDNAHFYLGVTLLEQNHWAQTEDSMEQFRAAVRQFPRDYFTNFYLGMGESQFKDLENSNLHLKVAAELDPTTPEIWLYLGLNTFQQDHFDTAKEYLLKAIELTGDDDARNNYQIRRAYIALGRIYFMAGDKERAEKYVQRAREMQNRSLAVSAETIAEVTGGGGMGGGPVIMPRVKMPEQEVPGESAQVDPTAPMDLSVLAKASLSPADQEQVKDLETQLRRLLSSSLNDWGTAEARQGLYTQALSHFHEAERWENSTPGLMRNMGLAALRLMDVPESIRALQVALQVDPQDRQAQARLAIILFRTDQYPEAAHHFEALGEAALSDPSLAYAWAYSLVRLNQEKKAGEVLNRLSQLETSPEMLISMGDLYGVLQDYEHAIASYRKALQLKPDVPRAHYKMGAALIRLDRPAEAVPQLEAELKISPQDADVQYSLAYALLQTLQKDHAVALLSSIVAAHPEHPQAQYQLGKTLLDGGQVEEAVQHLEAAARLDPERDYVHYQLQTAYRRLGRKDDADRELKVYREIKAQKRDAVTLPMPGKTP
jgi:tetratricopeptide (TPR) repeat protein